MNITIEDAKKLEVLTIENAATASVIVKITNPEWGTKRFNHNAQPLLDGEFCSTRGDGSVIFDSEFHFWAIVSYK